MSAGAPAVGSRPAPLAVVVTGALALRLALLLVRGDYIVYDEGYYLLLARSLRAGHGFTLNGLPHVSLSPLQPLLVALLSLTGLPDLWASRLVGAAAGALLAVPVASLARQWFGERAALGSAVLVAVSPGLLTFLPFFPGQRWNLYFGTEPLYLLLAIGALAAGRRAVREESRRWFVLLGILAALGYLTRLEGAVLAAGIAVVVPVLLAARGRLAAVLPRALAGAAVGLMVVAPYLFYLHHALGRWAVSGRVQAAVAAVTEPAGAGPSPRGGESGAGGPSDAVSAFVWGGDREALWRALYSLDATGTRMASQYWGVPPRADRGGAAGRAPAPAPAARAPSGWAVAGRALAAVMPWWFLLLALPGIGWARQRLEAALWLAPAALAAIVPAALAYVEPRALLIIAPVACVLASGSCAAAVDRLSLRGGRPWIGPAVWVAAGAGLLAPTARDLARSWDGTTPLQRAASARRAVGAYLRDHLPGDAIVVSWHPAIAVYAEREWRVLPYDSFERVLTYARAQRATAMVFSQLEPSPLRDPPRAFTALMLDSAAAVSGGRVRVQPVEETPLLFVGRLAPASAP